MLRTCISRCLPILGVAVLVSACHHPPAARSASSTWQPFCANFRVSDSEGKELTSGRYCRTSDGSDRRDTYSADPAHAGIQIRSVADEACYRFKAVTGWTRQPMRLPATGWNPKPTSGQEGTPVTVEGLAGRRLRNPKGDEVIDVPSLNGFRILRVTSGPGRRETYWNIVLGEPDRGVLRPPAGVAVRSLTQPAGIIAADGSSDNPAPLPRRK
jgi:hypothetical protein